MSSLSHYNIKKLKKTPDGKTASLDSEDGKWKLSSGEEVDEAKLQQIYDDIDEIVGAIESTVDDVQWVFFGYCPPKLEHLLKDKKIEVHGTTPILNYPNALKSLNLQLVVAPIALNEFNFCKSPIKFLECCALGVPLLATRCLPYTGVMDDSMLFSNGEELKDKILKIKFMSSGAYSSLVEANYKWFCSPHEDGDFRISNCWLDDNMRIWYDLFRLRKKPMLVDF